jgi:hypothetical protein
LDVEQIDAEALQLAQALLDSLEMLSEEKNLQAWVLEAKARAAEADSDPSVLLPADDILRVLRAKLR